MAKPNAQTDLNKQQQQQNNNITTELSINPDFMQNTTKKHYVLQVLHCGLFNTNSRQRSHSTGDVQRIPPMQYPSQSSLVHPPSTSQFLVVHQQTNDSSNMQTETVIHGNDTDQEINNKAPWQKVPQYSQKRNRSPEKMLTTHKLPKTNEARQQRFII